MRSLLLLLAAVPCAWCSDWPYWGGDAGGTRYSPLTEIDKTNVKRLEVAWTLDTGDSSDGTIYPSRSSFEAVPLVVDGVIYVATPFHRLVALDPETGVPAWVFDPAFDLGTRANLFTNRGVALRRDRKRIFLADEQARLFSIDVATGRPDPEFGDRGVVDLKHGMAAESGEGFYGLTSPVAVCAETVVTGSSTSDGQPLGPNGDLRGWDARTGKLIWRFHVVPHPGEFGNDTWEGDSWRGRGGVNAWSLMSVDEKRGLVFVPLTSPAEDFYGADRKGANLFGDSVLALDCRTGERRWHFQTVHHNLWDYDLPAQPLLARIGDRDAVVQVTKTGFVFVFDRDTGKPLFPVEERPVPASAVPGERSSPTQPVPLAPPPFARQSMRREDLTNVTPESRKECEDLVRDADVDTKLYDPLGLKLRVMFPGTNGGANWGGASYDPATATLYVNSMDVAALQRMAPRPPGSTLPFRNQGLSRFWDSHQYPCQAPPWGSLTAFDLAQGTIRWRTVLGEYPELTNRGVPKTGTPNLGGSIVTAGGLVFIAATNDSRFRAFDKDTGEELWSTELPASGHAVPITYTGPKTGRQYVAIAAGGGNKYNKVFAAKLVVFALPNGRPPVARQIAPAARTYTAMREKLPADVAPQPVPFSHRIHTQLMPCAACHVTAASTERAGLPDGSRCVRCHSSQPAVTGVRAADWVRVYRLPDFVSFSHAKHVNAGVKCEQCHGPVSTRDVLKKEVSTAMPACLDCHRARRVSSSCDLCHQLGQ